MSQTDPTTEPGHPGWPRQARLLAQAVVDSLRAALAADAGAFDTRLVELRRVDREQVATVLGAVTQELLERHLPDGLDAEGVEAVLDDCTAATRPWFPAFDESLVLRALTGALGIPDPDDAPAVDRDDVLVHGVLLVACLVRVTGSDPALLVDAALREVMRAQTVELP